MKKTEAELAAAEAAFFKTDFAANLIAASQNNSLLQIGTRMQIYSNINGILICFVIIKFLNYIEKFN
jgi:hypothetical protein